MEKEITNQEIARLQKLHEKGQQKQFQKKKIIFPLFGGWLGNEKLAHPRDNTQSGTLVSLRFPIYFIFHLVFS